MPTREDLILRDKSLMTRSMVLAEDAVSSIVPDLSELSSQEAGGAVRTIATGTVQQFGQVATVTATSSYQALRDIGMNDALANLIASTGRADAYLAQPIPVAAANRVDSVVGQTMKKYSQGQFVAAQSFLGQAVARVVGNIYRETQVTNSERDPRAVGYQRVASAGACSFCLTVALNQYTTFEQSGGYHTHCSCSSVPIFKGQQPYRPDYYDDFEKLYNQGRVDANSSKAGDIFRAIRRNMNRVEIPVPRIELNPAKVAEFVEVDWNDLPAPKILNDVQDEAFKMYQTDSYEFINKVYRDPILPSTSEIRGWKENLTEVLYENKIDKNITVYRHQDFYSGLNAQNISTLKGSVWNSKSPLSTYTPTAGGQRTGISDFEGLPVQFKIDVPEGSFGARITDNIREENEFVLAPNTDLLIVDVKEQNGRWLVEAVVTNQEKIS
jgi:hypothetical protein